MSRCKSFTRITFTVFTALLFATCAPLSLATTVLPPSFEVLVDRADLIFTGQVTAQRSEWKTINGERSIVTLVSFGVERVHKGPSSMVVTLQFLGGTVGDVTLDVAEMPKFRLGERVVLFVEGNGETVCPLIGFQHGKFLVRREADGRESMLKHDGEPLTQLGDLGRSKVGGAVRSAAPRGFSLAEFSAKVRERVAGGRKE